MKRIIKNIVVCLAVMSAVALNSRCEAGVVGEIREGTKNTVHKAVDAVRNTIKEAKAGTKQGLQNARESVMEAKTRLKKGIRETKETVVKTKKETKEKVRESLH